MNACLLACLVAMQVEVPTPEQLGFTAADAARLSKEKILLGREEFTQSYLAYRQQRLPYFITSDAMLNAFHVLFAESVFRMETHHARLLPGLLRRVDGGLREADPKAHANPDLFGRARERAMLVVATARTLLGDHDGPPSEAVAEVVRQIEAARGQGKPSWLGPPESDFVAIDFGRFRPRGFYTRTELLQRYFRAVAWLQSIPFRADKDEELLAIMLIGRSAGSPREKPDVKALTSSFKEFAGDEDDLDLTYFARLKEVPAKPQDWQGRVRRDWEANQKGKIQDQLILRDALPRPALRVLSALCLPDAVLFQKTTSPQRPFPTGLEVAAILDSAAVLPEGDRETLRPIVEECRELFKGSSLYQDYFECLQKLFTEPDKDAPDFMKSEAWKRKTRQTALAGWAQMRHTWALQAKQSQSVLAHMDRPPGFVEPNSEFFTMLASLAERAIALFEESGAFRRDPRMLGEDLARRFPDFKKADFSDRGLDEEGQLLLSLAAAAFAEDRKWNPEGVKRAERGIAQLLSGAWPTEGSRLEVLQYWPMDLSPLWRRMQLCCLRLATIAEKQLRQADFSKADRQFINEFGTLLGNLMLYQGNSGGTPQDDAPKIVDVHRAGVGGSLHVGVGRPRALYVLYPYQGKEWPCLGAVMPYYEFKSAERLDDSQWREMLSHPVRRPALPDWVQPLEASQALKDPSRK